MRQGKCPKCIHPDCECLDYCEAEDPYSETPALPAGTAPHGDDLEGENGALS